MSAAPPARSSSSFALAASVSRLHIVAIAALGTFTFGWIFTGRYAFGLALVCAVDWFIVNLLNRVVDLPEDRANAIRGVEFVARHRQALLVVGFGTLAASLVAVHSLQPEITPLRVAYHLLGLTYNWPIRGLGRRIKELYFWKNTASAIGFMLTVFGFPLAVAGLDGLAADISLATIAVAAVFFFLFELSYEVIYDLRDAPGDSASGVRTYPVVHGEAGAVRIIDGLIFASAAALIGGYVAGVVPWRLFVMIAAPALQLALYKRAYAAGRITSAFCVGITWTGAGLLLTYHVWQIAGLPGASGPP